MSVSFFGGAVPPPATYSSAIDRASARRYAYTLPSFESEKPECAAGSAGVTFAIALVAASRRYRWAYVRSLAEKKRPFGFQATMFGSSSKAEVRTAGVPPPAGI